MSNIVLNDTQSRHTLGSLTAQYLFNNIQINFSLHIRLILGCFFKFTLLTFVHSIFTRFKISLSLHLYNSSGTVLSHLTAASLEASILDSSPIICLHFIHWPTSLSHRGANWHEGSTCIRSPDVTFPRISPTWEVLTLWHHNRVYKQNCWMRMLLRTRTLNISLKASAPSHPTRSNESPYTENRKQKEKKGKKCCIESILTSRTEILVLPFLNVAFW